MSARRSFASASAIVMLLSLLAIMAALVAATQNHEDKRSDVNQRTFFMGSRYGRSGPPHKLLVSPRNDRFFMGSRYGKRSELAAAAPSQLSCRYTGVSTLYRCTADIRNPFLDSTSNISDEIPEAEDNNLGSDVN